MVVTYNLAGGANSAPIVLPANRAVLVMGANTAPNFRGVGQVTLLRIPAHIIWIGMEAPIDPKFTSGDSVIAGTHIVDIGLTVDIVVNSPNSIRIRNFGGDAETGTVTLIW